jgi:hypothetical protein
VVADVILQIREGGREGVAGDWSVMGGGGVATRITIQQKRGVEERADRCSDSRDSE